MNAAFAEFVAPWRAAFPALELASLYAEPAEADRLLARAVLLMECCDAVWRASDSKVTAAKLGWWAEEWTRMRSGAARHPLAQALAPASDNAPLYALLREAEGSPGCDDWSARLSAHSQVAAEFARAFAPADAVGSAANEAIALCWTALVSGRHLAALASGQPPALQATPLSARARHQLSVQGADAGSARAAAAEGAISIAAALQSQFALLPAAQWQGKRGARVLTAMAVRELASFDRASSRWGTIVNAWRAWRVARAVRVPGERG